MPREPGPPCAALSVCGRFWRASLPRAPTQILTRELEAVGIRLNRPPPHIYFKKRKTGGVSINATLPLTHLDDKLIQRVLQEYKIHNAELLFKEDATVDDLIDVIEVRACAAAAPCAWPLGAADSCRRFPSRC